METSSGACKPLGIHQHSPVLVHAQVDLNLLVDWNWPAFLYDVPAFVAAVPAPSDLTDLLFALRPGNMCDEGGLYAGIPIKPSPASPQLSLIMLAITTDGVWLNALEHSLGFALSAMLLQGPLDPPIAAPLALCCLACMPPGPTQSAAQSGGPQSSSWSSRGNWRAQELHEYRQP
eukprot:1157626-Pelagomonas_calceolata.AAC.15